MLCSGGTSTLVYRQAWKSKRAASHLANEPRSLIRSFPPAPWKNLCTQQKVEQATGQTPLTTSVQLQGIKDNKDPKRVVHSAKKTKTGIEKQPASFERTTNKVPPTTSVQPQGPKKGNKGLKITARNFKWAAKGVGRRLASIKPTKLKISETAVTHEVRSELLCSFNWARDTFSIYVPGHPPEWTPPTLPFCLSEDRGFYFSDENVARVPSCPYTPFFKALQVMRPSYKLDDVDIITNRGAFRKLFQFAANKIKSSFCIDFILVHNTLLMSRRLRNGREYRKNAKDPGWGHTFEKECTSPKSGLQESSSHHRAIRYNLGDLSCVVQSEIDAFYDSRQSQEPEHTVSRKVSSVKAASPPTESRAPGGLAVHKIGSVTPASQLAEIKTRPQQIRPGEVIPQLWFGRTPQLIMGIRKNSKGVFKKVNIRDFTPSFQEWETKNQDALRKLTTLLRRLKTIAKAAQGRVCVAILDKSIKPARLVIHTSTRKIIVPQEFLSEFWGL
ncbi:uncharacterized protein K452DRAFT_269880 [Aplosporella prunicola CBS 121167]|uniref:RAI1-like domain-containing protein n=1 Tax=Aplosporella prunicola CBS 121167 TaxID=1176127 RepID=A0A6A6BIC2_9PEZI|nr:uncharacterized protein K452DRAFT_269880 [Aplosporella prunicola CBS 121167]KAF2142311.1 hypothetical protein K452DRAFT_269880 [Aplosporella prunicola CBS 121167]